MPSKNSVNKPKQGLNNARRAAKLARKRAERLAAAAKPVAGVTTQSLSKKRLKKLERNARYALQRKRERGENVEEEMEDVTGDSEPETQKAAVRKMAWAAVEEFVASGVKLQTSGSGTTLGGPWL